MKCSHCGTDVPDGSKFCTECGATMLEEAPASTNAADATPAGAPTSPGTAPVPPTHVEAKVVSPKDRVAAGVLGILLGAFGAHKFYLGYTSEAIIMLLVTLLTFGVGACVMWVIGIVEGILYLTKTDDEFQRIYVYGRKGWF